MTDPVVVERQADIATVVLNRPRRMNVLDRAAWARLTEVMTAVSADDDVRCVVLCGAGDRAFSAGADIAGFESERADVASAEAYGRLMHRAMAAVGDCRHPTVARIHGVCVGGGLEIAAMCDLRLCGESSRFGVPVNRIGVVLAYPEMAAMIDLVGRARTLEILLEGRVFGAAEAKEMGLVNRVLPDAEVAAEATSTARRIADGAPLVNRWHKKFARRLRDRVPLDAGEFAEGFAAFGTADYREGRRAFLEKREPRFRGR